MTDDWWETGPAAAPLNRRWSVGSAALKGRKKRKYLRMILQIEANMTGSPSKSLAANESQINADQVLVFTFY